MTARRWVNLIENTLAALLGFRHVVTPSSRRLSRRRRGLRRLGRRLQWQDDRHRRGVGAAAKHELRHLAVPPQLRLGVDLADVVVGPAGGFNSGAGGGRIAFSCGGKLRKVHGWSARPDWSSGCAWVWVFAGRQMMVVNPLE